MNFTIANPTDGETSPARTPAQNDVLAVLGGTAAVVFVVGISIMIFVTICEAVDRTFQRRRAASRRVYLACQLPQFHGPGRATNRRRRSAERTLELHRMWRTISGRLAENRDEKQTTCLPNSGKMTVAPISFAQIAMQVKQQQVDGAAPEQSTTSDTSLPTTASHPDGCIMLCPDQIKTSPNQRPLRDPTLRLPLGQIPKPKDRVMINLNTSKSGNTTALENRRTSASNSSKLDPHPQFLQSTLV